MSNHSRLRARLSDDRVLEPFSRVAGFTLIEQMIAIGISSVVFATVFLGYRIYLDTFDQQLEDTRLWVDLRESATAMKADLRDASAVSNPPSAGLLMTFILKKDGLTYSYYINGNKSLVRQVGTSGTGGRVVAKNMDPVATTVTQSGGLITLQLVTRFAGQTARLTSRVRPRNL